MSEEQSQARGVPPLGRCGPQPDTIAPDGSEIRLLVDSRHGARGASLCQVTLPPGQVSRPVRHRTVEEVWYVLKGRGQVWRCAPGAPTDVAEPLDVGPADALTIPTGWSFQFASAQGEALTFLCFTLPPWPGEGEAQSAGAGGLGPPTV